MYDIIIIGAGPAGMSAAIYGQRAGKKTLLLDEKGFGGQILNTPQVENYPGIKATSGFQLASSLYEQATELGAEIKYAKVDAIEQSDGQINVITAQETFEGKAVIIAVGARNRPLGIADEERFVGSGVSYCAACDGMFFRGKSVAVIGGGNTALEDAEVLSGLASKVYLVHRRDEFRGEAANVKRLEGKENIEFVLNHVPEALVGEGLISGIKVKEVNSGEERLLDVQGVFVAIGQLPDTEEFAPIIDLDEKGYVIAGEDCETTAKGIFVAGDCRTKKVRQLTTAAADGAVAALAAVEYINRL